MPIVIDNPTAEEKLHAFATSRGLTVDQAIIAAIMNAEEAQEPPLTDDELERALRGKAQLEAGEYVTLDEFKVQGAAELERLLAEKEKRAKAA